MRHKTDTDGIINKYYAAGSLAHEVFTGHARVVAGKALAIADAVRHLSPDRAFIEEAARLHDIGIYLTHSPEIGCHGKKEYICHGYLGRELLEREGLPDHALVCERHIGTGLSVSDIERYNLPLPRRDMLPVTLEEKIICYADKFFSKKPGSLMSEKSPDEIRREFTGYGDAILARFEEMLALFSR